MPRFPSKQDSEDESKHAFGNNDSIDEETSSSESSDGEEQVVPLRGRKAMLAAHATRPDFIPQTIMPKTTEDATVFRNRQRVLLLCSRGITQRYRHFMKDLEALMPHVRKESKFDSKGNLMLLNELADLNNCNNAIYLECRKKQDLYMWMSKTPHGPSAKFLIQNVHTMDELKMAGNCLKGSRPLLSFDKTFDSKPHYRLLKELFLHMFGTPKGHRKSKPFFDHVLTFTIADERVWFRNYQIIEKTPMESAEKKEDTLSLVEIGPRFVMTPIRMFSGSFGGPTLWQNEEFVSPNAVRADMRRERGKKYVQRTIAEQERQRKMDGAVPPRTDMDDVDEVFR